MPRLAMCARLASGASVLCDVGTDHGYLPISLLMERKIEYAVAADIRRGPLESAKRHAAEAGCENNQLEHFSDNRIATPSTKQGFLEFKESKTRLLHGNKLRQQIVGDHLISSNRDFRWARCPLRVPI